VYEHCFVGTATPCLAPCYERSVRRVPGFLGLVEVIALPNIADHFQDLLSTVEAISRSLATIERRLNEQPATDQDRSYSRAEVAAKLGVSTRTVDRLRKRGVLSAQRIGRSVRITGGSLTDYQSAWRAERTTKVLRL